MTSPISVMLYHDDIWAPVRKITFDILYLNILLSLRERRLKIASKVSTEHYVTQSKLHILEKNNPNSVASQLPMLLSLIMPKKESRSSKNPQFSMENNCSNMNVEIPAVEQISYDVVSMIIATHNHTHT
jgi:hypothetical protein